MFRFGKESMKIESMELTHFVFLRWNDHLSQKEEKYRKIQPASTNPNAAKAKGTLDSRAMYTVQVGLE